MEMPGNMEAQGRSSDRISVAIVIAGILVALIYFGFPDHRYLSDGLNAALLVREHGGLYVHPNHPLYPLLPGLIYNMMGRENSGMNELEALLVWSMFVGVFACWAMLAAMRIGSIATAATVAGLGLFAFTKGIWFFSVIPAPSSSAMAPQVFALVAIVYASRRWPDGPTRNEIVLMGLLTSIAILANQMNAALLLPAGYVMFQGTQENRAKVRNLLMLLGIVALSTFLVFFTCAVAIEGIRTPAGFLAWQHSYVYDTRWWVHGFADAIKRNWTGVNEVLVANTFKPDGLFGNWREGLNTPIWYIRLIIRFGQAIVLGFFAFETIRALVAYIKGTVRHTIQTLGLAVAVPLIAFSTIWTPETIHYRVLYIPGLILLLAPSLEHYYGLAQFRMRRAWPIVLVIIALFATNLVTQFIPQSDPGNNPYLNEIFTLDKSIGKDDVIIFSGSDEGVIRSLYAQYFLKCEAIKVHELIPMLRQHPDEVMKEFLDKDKAGHRLLIHEDALYSVGDVEYMNKQFNMDIRPGEMLEFMQSWAKPVGQIKLNGKNYFQFVPKDVGW
jgi:hypothetical protein